MKKISIKDIAKFCGAEASVDGEISRISTDSRDVDENTLFIALVGERFNANDFVKDVLGKGAKAVICSRKVCDDERLICVEDTSKALLQIANGYRKTFNIPISITAASCHSSRVNNVLGTPISLLRFPAVRIALNFLLTTA